MSARSLSVLTGDLSTTEEEKHDSLSCSLCRWNIWFQFGCVCEQKKKKNPVLVHVQGSIKNWEVEPCGTPCKPLPLVVKLQFSAVCVFLLLHVALTVGCGFPEAPSCCCHCSRLCSYSARLGRFTPLISFFILIKEGAESGIPAAHFYYT